MESCNKTWVLQLDVEEEMVTVVAGPGVEPLGEEVQLTLEHRLTAAVQV